MFRNVLILICTVGFAYTLHAQGAVEPLPNIIFILADDMGYGDLGCYGQKKIQTPNIDALARRGMRFTDFYSGSTVCAPSRASLMTGQHTGHVYIRGNGELPMREADSILPQVLKQKGYVNGMVGKWGLGLQNTPGVPEKKGWDYFAGHLHHVEGHYQESDSIWIMQNGITAKQPARKSDLNELFTTYARDFIVQHERDPFFLYVSYTLPHAGLTVPDRFLKKYLDKNGNSRFAPETAHPAGKHYAAQPFPRAAYAAMITGMDSYVGSLMELLKSKGLDKNTIVIFASDNGTHIEGGRTMQDAMEVFHSSGPFRGIKRDLYEGGIRVPFIVSWPAKIAANITSNYIGAFWDVLPTLAGITGAKAPENDGISFYPALLQQAQPKHDFLYWEFYENGFRQAVRKDNWKAIRYFKNGKPDHTELYDLRSDPGEAVDLAAREPGRCREMETAMDASHRTSESSLFRIP
ncbi:arylsulfatase [Flavihumibacter solisilvae]|uniref:Chloramphenicol resistance protein n=1 Tax=Flavihumibacter solisilvae TaxID=1349421 RepID=A0A0C1L797_9BACT|nr:arylsulfatase [Flavihumibacter solisilvae]KIC96022.1 chloramphenicol resistance protein [Flavihumibacter solisilvae]